MVQFSTDLLPPFESSPTSPVKLSPSPTSPIPRHLDRTIARYGTPKSAGDDDEDDGPQPGLDDASDALSSDPKKTLMSNFSLTEDSQLSVGRRCTYGIPDFRQFRIFPRVIFRSHYLLFYYPISPVSSVNITI